MKIFLHFFLVIFCLFTHLNAYILPDFTHKSGYKLKKDQKAWILVKKKNEQNWHKYEFSWTLYQDGINIILHTKYNEFIKQIILSNTAFRNTFKQKLFLDKKNPYSDNLSLVLVFDSFKSVGLDGISIKNTNNAPDNNENSDTNDENQDENKMNKITPPYAVFKVFIKDKKNDLMIDFYPKNAIFPI